MYFQSYKNHDKLFLSTDTNTKARRSALDSLESGGGGEGGGGGGEGGRLPVEQELARSLNIFIHTRLKLFKTRKNISSLGKRSRWTLLKNL